MKRVIVAICLVGAGWSGMGLAAHPALAATLCVGNGAGCYGTIQAALNAAHDGDVIHIGAGTFAGGITITKSVTIVGAGSTTTIIKGGGPVVTIGQDRAAAEPTVSITGVTITGGVTTSATECAPVDVCVPRYYPATALGGGILVPPAAGLAAGATVRISNSVITGNRAAPTTTVPSATATCPGGPCPYATGAGGGIDTWGAMTLSDTSVVDNQAGGPSTSEGLGGGIAEQANGSLTLINSTVSSNHATSVPPYGRYADAGGIWMDAGPLTIANSTVSGNDATLSSTYPVSVVSQAFAGGIAGPTNGTVTIDNTQITGNTVSVTDPNGGPAAFDAGLNAKSATLILRNSSVSDNHVTANVVTTDSSGPDGNALEFDGPATVANTRITGNTATVTASAGTAGAVGAVIDLTSSPQSALISNSVISDNTMQASSPSGTATVQGGGIVNNGPLELRNDLVIGNSGNATGTSGFAQGGGIWNGTLFNPPPMQLSLENTRVTGNSLSASPGLEVQGGGLYTFGFPVTLSHSVIAGNVPDQCVGC